MHKTFLYKSDNALKIYGARENNLKNIDVSIPRNCLTVITGLSGSGKTSLAFDTIYAEGQRRYIETFAAYARQFLGNLERPDVDKINGLSPVISIEQKSTNKNPRSTVGTVTEIYDFLRLLFARIAEAYSYITGEKMIKYSDEKILDLILQKHKNKSILLLAPLIKGRKGHYRELFEQIQRQGFLKARIDGKIKEITYGMRLDRYKVHDIEIVIDKISVNDSNRNRLSQSLQAAMKYGKGMIMLIEESSGESYHFSRNLMCPKSGIAYDDPEPNNFSFNSPYGACPKCNGIGSINELSIEMIIPDMRKTIRNGGIKPLGTYKNNWIFKQIEAIGHKYDFDLDTPIEEISQKAINVILYGSDEIIKVKNEVLGITDNYSLTFEGIINFINNQYEATPSKNIRKWALSFMKKIDCPECNGQRLKKESLYFKIGKYNIAGLAEMDLLTLKKELINIEKSLEDRKKLIAKELMRELKERLDFLLKVGLDYLALNRPIKSLSGGESQRIRLATQIGTQLTGVLYILDEPSIGLHQRDNRRLTDSLRSLRDIGNSLVIVEHDRDIILSADHIVDMGPGAGDNGGYIVAEGTPAQIMQQQSSTSQYLRNEKEIPVPVNRRKGNEKKILLKGARGHNLKNINLEIPLGTLICVTGVSGSGKSSLINETLYPIISNKLYKSDKPVLPYNTVDGIKNIDKVIKIDQSPIGRTPRSNPATYTKVFDEIRKIFASLPESQVRGYKPGRFSFNVKGGRCETCQGGGRKVIEMNFLPDVHVLCETCQGLRYNRETLEVRYKGKSISDVLNMSIKQALEFFENIPAITQKIKTLSSVGLGYLTLGQSSTSLSGGEAQRVKLAAELSKKDTGKTLYILDEPTTGLHFEDVRVLMKVLNYLIDKGNTIIIIEHNMDVIKVADYIIDLGPEGGKRGGEINCHGTPEEVAKATNNHTAQFLGQALAQTQDMAINL